MEYFQTKNPNLGKVLEGLAIEDVGTYMYILHGHLVYFMAIWYILLPFGICYGYLVYFPRLGMLCQEKSGSPVAQ
jgi:hypothetical protein